MDDCNQKVKNIIENCMFDSKKECELDTLLSYFWEGGSYKLLYYFYIQAQKIEDYRMIAYILEEGPFCRKDICYTKKLLPLLKKLIKINDLHVINTVFTVFTQYALTSKDLSIVLHHLINKKYIFNSSIYWAILSLTDIQLKEIIKIKSIVLPLYLFDKKTIVTYDILEKLILNNDSIVYREVVVLSAMIHKLDKNLILRLSNLSKNKKLIEFVKQNGI